MSSLQPAPWKLAHCNYGDIRDREFDVAVLPLGATEPHNLHLPYGTDSFQAEAIGDRICQMAHDRGAKVILLPTIPFGTETNLSEFPLAINLNPSTMGLVITDIVQSLVDNGVHKILLLNSHGGNDFKPLLRELHGMTPAKLFLCNWFKVVRDVYNEIFEHDEDHAGEMETSMGLAFFSELVARNGDGKLTADEGVRAKTRFEAVNEGWVSITRPWHLLTTNSGAGNPHSATADKGHRVMEILVQRLGGFLVDLAASPVDERFPF